MIMAAGRYGLVVGLIVVFLVGGCATTKKKSGEPYEFKTYRLSPDLLRNPPRSVAVLPFSNSVKESKLLIQNWRNVLDEEKRFDIETEQRRTEEYLQRMFVRRAFYKHFSIKPYRDRELIAVDQILKSHDIEWAEDLNTMTPGELAAALEVDALVYGEITHLNRVYFGLYSEVAVGATVTMIDARTNEIVWQVKEIEKLRGGGAALSLTGLATSLLDATLNMRKIWVFRVADDLFRRVSGYLPDNEVAVEPTLIVMSDTAALSESPGRFGMNAAKKKGKLKDGDVLRIIEEADEWYLVRCDNGNEGWIDPKDTKFIGRELARPFDVDTGAEDMNSPTNAEMAGLYDLQGTELFKQGEFHKAHEAFSKAVRYDTQNAAIHYHLAWATRMDPLVPEDEQIRLAIRHLREAVKRAPTVIQYRYNLGLIYYEAGHPARALVELKRCLELDPSLDNVKTLIELAEEQLLTDNQRPLVYDDQNDHTADADIEDERSETDSAIEAPLD